MKGQVLANDTLVQIKVCFPDGGSVVLMKISQVFLTSEELQEGEKNGKQMCFWAVCPLRVFGPTWKWTSCN